MSKTKTTTINIEITNKLLNILNDYFYEMEYDIEEYTLNDFIIDAIIEKFNNDNNIFNGVINKDGFIKD